MLIDIVLLGVFLAIVYAVLLVEGFCLDDIELRLIAVQMTFI